MLYRIRFINHLSSYPPPTAALCTFIHNGFPIISYGKNEDNPYYAPRSTRYERV